MLPFICDKNMSPLLSVNLHQGWSLHPNSTVLYLLHLGDLGFSIRVLCAFLFCSSQNNKNSNNWTMAMGEKVTEPIYRGHYDPST